MPPIFATALDAPPPPPSRIDRLKSLYARIGANAAKAYGAAAALREVKKIVDVLTSDKSDDEKTREVFAILYANIRGPGATGSGDLFNETSTDAGRAVQKSANAALDGAKLEVLTRQIFTLYLDP